GQGVWRQPATSPHDRHTREIILVTVVLEQVRVDLCEMCQWHEREIVAAFFEGLPRLHAVTAVRPQFRTETLLPALFLCDKTVFSRNLFLSLRRPVPSSCTAEPRLATLLPGFCFSTRRTGPL